MLYIIVGIAVIFIIVGLCFSPVYPSHKLDLLLSLVGFDASMISFNGYRMIGMPDDLSFMSTIEKVVAIESLLQLIFGIVLLVFLVSVYFLNKGKREEIFHNITLFLALFFTIFYTIAGMILLDQINSSFWQAFTSSSGMTKHEVETMYGNIGLNSVCWLPCVIEALLFLAYQIIYGLMPDDFSVFGKKLPLSTAGI